MDKKIDFKKYTEFVDAVTSDASTDFLALSDRLVELDEKGANIERLLTGFIGMTAESAEGLDLVKKLVFQNKEWNPEIREHLIKECGDVCFYLAEALIALNISLEEVIQKNIEKLSARYPNGCFEAFYSENRQKGDV
jgi:NTP pyrophosphatase (non-canonical NTP hydrolase)